MGRPKKPLTKGQIYRAESIAYRARCVKEIEMAEAAGKTYSIPELATKYERTPQCIYLWRDWGRKKRKELSA